MYCTYSSINFVNRQLYEKYNCHCEPRSGVAIRTVIQRALPTAPRTKRVHSNSNRKNTFSDYEFSIFTPVLNFFHAHRVSAKELRSKSLNLFAIRHECRTEIRSARLAEESLSNLVRDISLSLVMTAM